MLMQSGVEISSPTFPNQMKRVTVESVNRKFWQKRMFNIYRLKTKHKRQAFNEIKASEQRVRSMGFELQWKTMHEFSLIKKLCDFLLILGRTYFHLSCVSLKIKLLFLFPACC